MGLAKLMQTEDTEVSDEARERILSARERDFVFRVRRVLGGQFTDDDVLMVARALLEILGSQKPLSQELLTEELRKRGRSPEKSKELAAALIR